MCYLVFNLKQLEKYEAVLSEQLCVLQIYNLYIYMTEYFMLIIQYLL